MKFLERIHLEILLSVERQGSMTAASQELCLTQSALSHCIRKLENQLNIKIWHREGRQLRPTQAGKQLLLVARRLIPQFLHAEACLEQLAKGERGQLRAGMECHACYRWLRKISDPFLKQWPLVELDVKQQFQFGAIGALFSREIDLLVTPDPLFKKGLYFKPVFDYQQVLVTSHGHPFTSKKYIQPKDLCSEVLFTYPVPLERLDIYTHFLTPAGIEPKKHKMVEDTDIMLQMIACKRGVGALPLWLVEEYKDQYPITALQLGAHGIDKKIFLGIRQEDKDVDYLRSFLDIAASFYTH